jgi:hypothetical protein
MNYRVHCKADGMCKYVEKIDPTSDPERDYRENKLESKSVYCSVTSLRSPIGEMLRVSLFDSKVPPNMRGLNLVALIEGYEPGKVPTGRGISIELNTGSFIHSIEGRRIQLPLAIPEILRQLWSRRTVDLIAILTKIEDSAAADFPKHAPWLKTLTREQLKPLKKETALKLCQKVFDAWK